MVQHHLKMGYDSRIKPHDCVPWVSPSDFVQVVMSFERIEILYEPDLAQLRETARRMRKEYLSLAGPMHEICASACPDCRNVCCRRATVWFDFQDLLYLYFGTCNFPESQIVPKYEKDFGRSCCFFSENGCILERHARPFVCTWYVCPAQKHYIAASRPDLEGIINSGLDTIKRLRNALESEFFDIITPGVQESSF